MNFITLTAIVLDNEPSSLPAPVSNVVGMDDLERPLTALRSVDAPPSDAELGELLKTYPVVINVAHIREFYPRKKQGYWPGTRVVYANSSAVIVKETFTEVKELLAAAARVN